MFRRLDQRSQKFYDSVAAMVSRINGKRSTIKGEVYRTKTPERYQAILHKVLLNYDTLKRIVKKTQLMKNIPLGTVIAHELLTKKIRNDGYRRKLKTALGEEKLKEVKTYKFVRINTLKASETDLDGFCVKPTCIPHVYEIFDSNPATTADVDEQQDAGVASSDERSVDVAEGTGKRVRDLFKCNLVPEKIKIQNFSSCLPAFILNPEEGSIVIDAAASPGNKTTHMCSIMNNTGKIYAFERNKERYNTLVSQVEAYGASNVETVHGDFLKATPESYKPDYILLDPSCSGSGIHMNYKKVQERIDKLGNFQAMMLNHALKFDPKRVVYSVCSEHQEEGEDVIKEALEKNPGYEVARIEDYTGQRGHPGYDFSDRVLRTSGETQENTIGFFVALLQKKMC